MLNKLLSYTLGAPLCATLLVLRQVPVIQHSESERDKVWSKVHSADTAEEVIPVITAWQLNERM